MKQFFKMVLAVFVGLALLGVVGVLALLAVVGIAAEHAEPELPAGNSVLRIRLQGSLVERSKPTLASLFGNDEDYEYGLDDLLTAVREAETDKNIKGILIEPGAFSGGFASLCELRNAILHFRKSSGKFVYAYSGAYSQGGYYLASAADSVFLNPDGVVDFRGLAYRSSFYKQLLDKVGIQMQVVKVGTFKSFTEQYTNRQMSPASRLQATQLVGDLWATVLRQIADSRHLQVGQLNAAADSFQSFRSPEADVKLHLVDRLVYADEVSALLRRKLALAAGAEVPFSEAADYAQSLSLDDSGSQVAVLYAAGEIDNGNEEGISSKKICAEMDKLRNNDKVKAVVLRINSPGGSAYGSEQMWRSLQLLKQKKPVVVSMGDYAASGGYYMACSANAIVADPVSITGSIGIFGVIPNVQNLAEKVGMDYDVVKTNRNADFPAIFRPMSPDEARLLQLYVNRGYAQFVKRCADGRHRSVAQIEAVAQGHVWSGTTAQRIGLVDELGDLQVAIQRASRLAKLKVFCVASYPAKDDVWSDLFHLPALGVRAFQQASPFYKERMLLLRAQHLDCLQAALPSDISIY